MVKKRDKPKSEEKGKKKKSPYAALLAGMAAGITLQGYQTNLLGNTPPPEEAPETPSPIQTELAELYAGLDLSLPSTPLEYLKEDKIKKYFETPQKNLLQYITEDFNYDVPDPTELLQYNTLPSYIQPTPIENTPYQIPLNPILPNYNGLEGLLQQHTQQEQAHHPPVGQEWYPQHGQPGQNTPDADALAEAFMNKFTTPQPELTPTKFTELSAEYATKIKKMAKEITGDEMASVVQMLRIGPLLNAIGVLGEVLGDRNIF